MATSSTTADDILDAIGNASSFVISGLYIQLHTGDPGASGTANVATNSTRKSCSFAASSGGSMASDAEILWTAVPATETYTYASVWDASSSGTFVGSGTVTNGSVTAGNNFRIPSGDLVLSMSVAS